jgi:hypothetical protein
MSNTRNWSIKKLTLFSLITVLALFLIIELGSRFIFWLQYGRYHTTLSIQWNPRWISDPRTIWTNRPFYLEAGKKFQYNECGMRVERGDVLMSQKTKDDFWVFLFGGSAMAGMGSNKDGEWIRITGVYDHPIEESIDGYLEKMLQEKLKDKKVRVFNAAVSGHSIYQSHMRYIELSKYKPDWIVSMDGVNEPSSLKETETILSYLQQEWQDNPAQNLSGDASFFKKLRPASYFLLSRYVYNFRENKRVDNVLDSVNYFREKWLKQPSSLKKTPVDKSIEHAVTSFFENLVDYKNTLQKQQQNYLLLIQPHISQRDTTKLEDTEKATYNYYLDQQKSTMNTFYELTYEKIGKKTGPENNIYLMKNVSAWSGQVFVDYCHFTKEANKKIAAEISQYILSESNDRPFGN